MLNTAGAINTGLGYAAAIIPGTEEFAPPLLGAGSALSGAGSGIKFTDDLSNKNYGDATTDLLLTGANLYAGSVIGKLSEAGEISNGMKIGLGITNEAFGHIGDAIHDKFSAKADHPAQNSTIVKGAQFLMKQKKKQGFSKAAQACWDSLAKKNQGKKKKKV